MKKLTFLILTVMTVQLLICSCKYYKDDPFLPETDIITDAITGSGKENVTESSATETNEKVKIPPEDFYSLSQKESEEKYGIFPFAAGNYDEKYCYDDNNYYYCDLTGKQTDSKGNPTLNMTLFYTDKYNKDKSHGNYVCKDPLCLHTEESGCPLAGIIMLNFYVKNGYVFFVKNKTALMMYSFETNKSKQLLGGKNINNVYLRHYEDSLIVQYQEFIEKEDAEEEKEEFTIQYVFCRLSDDGKLTEIGRAELSGVETAKATSHMLYNERCVILANQYLTDNSFIGTVELYDLKTGEITKVFEKDYKKDPDYADFIKNVSKKNVEIRISPAISHIYNGKTIFKAHLTVGEMLESGVMYGKSKDEYYMIDVSTKEAEKISYDRDLLFTFSDKYLIYRIKRKNETEPLIIHVIDMINNAEKIYDLSDILGKTLPLEVDMINFERGSIVFSYSNGRVDESMIFYKIYALDLESGRVYKYEYPES